MSELPFTPAGLRAQAAKIRQSAHYAQGKTRRDELEEAQALERQAAQLERSLSEASQ
jgi:hypothetical protein